MKSLQWLHVAHSLRHQTWRHIFWVIMLLLAGVIIMMPHVVFAQQWGNDCSMKFAASPAWGEDGFVTSVTRAWEDDPYLWKRTFFTDKDLRMIYTQFKCQCCDSNPTHEWCTEFTCKIQKYFAESPFLFDHLVTVGMKKLDGVQETCDDLQIDCHEKATERREWITQQAEHPEWAPPSLIWETFEKHRWWAGEENNIIDDKKNITQAYRRMCEEANFIEQHVSFEAKNLAVTNKNKNPQTRIQACTELVNKRYVQESTYVRTLMVQKWIDYVVTNINSYLSKYFVKNRLYELLQKYTELDGCVSTVLKMANKKTVNCK